MVLGRQGIDLNRSCTEKAFLRKPLFTCWSSTSESELKGFITLKKGLSDESHDAIDDLDFIIITLPSHLRNEKITHHHHHDTETQCGPIFVIFISVLPYTYSWLPSIVRKGREGHGMGGVQEGGVVWS
jgi:hypothetical protein